MAVRASRTLNPAEGPSRGDGAGRSAQRGTSGAATGPGGRSAPDPEAHNTQTAHVPTRTGTNHKPSAPDQRRPLHKSKPSRKSADLQRTPAKGAGPRRPADTLPRYGAPRT